MKKILFAFIFAGLGLMSSLKSHAYCAGVGCYTPSYGYGYGYGGMYYNPSKLDLAAFATDNFFYALGSALDASDEMKAMENDIQVRRNNLENSKSVQSYYNGTIVPFAPVGPTGKPRPPKITWKDVQSIRWE